MSIESPIAEAPAPAAAPLVSGADGPDDVLEAPVVTKVSIVIPVYNEEHTVQKLVGLIVRAPLPAGVTREVVCVNDCSKDGTARKLDELPKLFPKVEFRIVHKDVNEGKGAAL